MAWSTDAEVARVLADRGWDGSVPVTTGDFVYPAEFEYAAKHGRELRRTYDHHVALRPDGSARITTTREDRQLRRIPTRCGTRPTP